jgi:hypothetical protein
MILVLIYGDISTVIYDDILLVFSAGFPATFSANSRTLPGLYFVAVSLPDSLPAPTLCGHFAVLLHGLGDADPGRFYHAQHDGHDKARHGCQDAVLRSLLDASAL